MDDESYMTQAQRDRARLKRMRANPAFMAEVLGIKAHPFHPDMRPHERKIAAVGQARRRALSRRRRSSKRSMRKRTRGRGRGRGAGLSKGRGNRAGRGRGTRRR